MFVGQKCRMYSYDISGDGSEFELRFEIDGEIKEAKREYCFENILYSSSVFLSDCCEKYQVDTRYDTLVVELIHRF